MATDTWLHSGPANWETFGVDGQGHPYWSTLAPPKAGDDVVITNDGAPVVESNVGTVNSVTVASGSLLFRNGELATTAGVLLEKNMILGSQNGNHGSSLTVGGALTVDAAFVDDASLDIAAKAIHIGSDSTFFGGDTTVTAGALTNSATKTSSHNFGLYIGSSASGTTAVLKVTGTLTNKGTMAAGDADSTTNVTIGALDNTATGGIDLDNATMKVARLDNAGAPSGTLTAGIGVDSHAGSFGSSLTVSDVLTNTGDLVIGNANEAKAGGTTHVSIGQLDNDSTGGVNISYGVVRAPKPG